jgi:hypothetical protein
MYQITRKDMDDKLQFVTVDFLIENNLLDLTSVQEGLELAVQDWNKNLLPEGVYMPIKAVEMFAKTFTPEQLYEAGYIDYARLCEALEREGDDEVPDYIYE